MRIVWTGKGWLAFPIVVVTLLIGGFAAVPLSSNTALGSDAALGTIPLAFALAAFPSYLLGRALNSTVGADGRRVWHNRHRFGTRSLFGTGPGALFPLQGMWIGELGVAYIPLAVFIGGVLLNSGVVVWVLWLAPIVAGVVAVITVRRRRKAAVEQAAPMQTQLDQVRARSRRATQAIKAGQTMRFGGISVSKAGIEWGGRMLPFRDIERIHHDHVNLYCQLSTGTYSVPLAEIGDHAVAVGVAIGLHRAATGVA